MPAIDTDCTYDCTNIHVEVTYDGSIWDGGPAVRIDGSSTITDATLYAVIYNSAAGQITVRKWMDESLSLPGTALSTVSQTLSTNDVLAIEITTANRIAALVNDAEIAASVVTDGSIPNTNLCVGSVNLL